MKMKKYFVPDGKKKFLTTVLNRDEIDYDFMEIDGRLYIWTPLSCRQYRVMLEDIYIPFLIFYNISLYIYLIIYQKSRIFVRKNPPKKIEWICCSMR